MEDYIFEFKWLLFSAWFFISYFIEKRLGNEKTVSFFDLFINFLIILIFSYFFIIIRDNDLISVLFFVTLSWSFGINFCKLVERVQILLSTKNW